MDGEGRLLQELSATGRTPGVMMATFAPPQAPTAPPQAKLYMLGSEKTLFILKGLMKLIGSLIRPDKSL